MLSKILLVTGIAMGFIAGWVMGTLVTCAIMTSFREGIEGIL